MSKIDELKKEAKELGIAFSPNIGEAKLAAKIEEAKKAQKAETPAEEPTEQETWMEKAAKAYESGKEADPMQGTWNERKRRELVAKREAEARKTKIVTIIDNDQRVNNQTTSATVTCSNQFFDLGTMILPLNVEVEVMQGHIDVLKEVKIPQHVKGNDGLSRVVLRPRYTISYSDKTPE